MLGRAVYAKSGGSTGLSRNKKKKTLLREEFKNLLAGKSVLQMEEIMQKSDYVHM
jgi:hypothetical protein